jgi:hypothetical protein
VAGAGSRRISQRGSLLDSLLDVAHRHRDANAAGRGDQDFRRRNIQCGRGESGHCFGVEAAPLAGAGIGIAGIDNERTSHAAPDSLHAQAHRRGANLVGGKSPGDSGRRERHHQSEIAFRPFVGPFARAEAFNIAEHASGREPLRRRHRSCDAVEQSFFHQCEGQKRKRAGLSMGMGSKPRAEATNVHGRDTSPRCRANTGGPAQAGLLEVLLHPRIPCSTHKLRGARSMHKNGESRAK